MNPGRAVTTLLTQVILASFGASHLAAQATPVPSLKSPIVAGVLEWLTVPTVGYAYAGDWSRGMPSALVRLAGAGLAISAMEDEPGEPRAAVGVVMLVGGTIFAVIDAGYTAARENQRRRAAQSSISTMPDFEDGRIGVRVRVALGW